MKKTTIISMCLFFTIAINAQINNFQVLNPSGSYSITCRTPSIKLMAASNHSSAVSYSFVGPSSTLTGSNVVITTPGQYTVSALASGGQTASLVVTIFSNTTAPSATVTPSTQAIVCGGTAVITASANPSINITHSILSPLGGINKFGQPVLSYTALVPGTYKYMVTDNVNGCTYSTAVNVTGSGFPTFSLVSQQNFTIGCSTSSVAYVQMVGGITSPFGGQVSYTLLSPGSGAIQSGSLSAVTSYSINTPGTWTAVIRDDNTGCLSKVPFTITSETLSPLIDVYVPQSILDCYTPSITLLGYSGTPNVNYVWKYPGTPPTTAASLLPVYSKTSCPTCTLVANYTLVVEDNSSSCESKTVIPIYQNVFFPKISVLPATPTISCLVPSVALTSTITTGIPLNSIFPSTGSITPLQWISKSNGTLTGSTSYTAQSAGIYTYVVMDTNNGCITSTFVNVIDVGVAPGIFAPVAPFNLCTNTQVTIFPAITSMGTYTFSWFSPTGATVFGVNTPSLTTDTPGAYALTIFESSDCYKVIIVNVVACVGINQAILSSNSVHVSPNPNTGKLTIQLENKGTAEFILYDLRGVKIVHLNSADQIQTIDISTQPNGFYLLEIKQGGAILRSKVVKE